MPSVHVFIHELWDSIANRGLELLGRRGLNNSDSRLASVCSELLSERGEASGIALAREIVARYGRLTPPERLDFFHGLLDPAFLPNPDAVIRAADDYRNAPGAETLSLLFTVAEPRRQELFRRINVAPGGTALIVQIRADLLGLLPANPELKPIDIDLRHLLASWFNRGFLHLERIDWRTSADVLEKLILHEAVHKIEGWEDLQGRLKSGRRCFAFFHPALPRQPIIFIQVALTRGAASSIQKLLIPAAAPAEAARANTAVFYSITNCLEGLRGISFGNFLIKRVIAEMEAEGLRLRSFITLSPLPGFRQWWQSLSGNRRAELTLPGEMEALAGLDAPGWHASSEFRARVEPVLVRLGAWYVAREQNGRRALDPVAAFHLGNGATVEKIHFLADISGEGMGRSFGLMVNYAYRQSQLERNHEAYVKHGRVAASASVRSLLAKVDGVRIRNTQNGQAKAPVPPKPLESDR